MSDIKQRVVNIIVDHLGVDTGEVVDAADFVNDLGADSLDTVELIMALEDEFSIEITDDVSEGLFTVADVVRVVSELVRG